jgi:hypothetical protein
VVPDSKARTKIARDRNASGNSASAKNKAVAANKEATSKADDKSGLSEYSDGGGNSRRLLLRVPIAFSCKPIYNRRVHSARFCSYEIEHKG